MKLSNEVDKYGDLKKRVNFIIFLITNFYCRINLFENYKNK